MNRLLTNKLIGLMLKAPFQPAKVNASGEMVFRKQKWWAILIHIGLILGWIGVGLSFTPDMAEEEGLVYLIRGSAVLFTLLWLDYVTYQVVATNSEVRGKKWFSQRTILYSEVTHVGHTRFRGGQFTIEGPQGKIRIPDGATGVTDFIALMTNRIGEGNCLKANEALDKKKAEMERFLK